LHRQAGMRVAARLRLAELALRKLVAAVDGRASQDLVDLDVTPRLDLGAAPRAARELRGRCDAGAVAVLVANRFDGSMGLLRRPGRHLVANPEAERERLRAPLGDIGPTERLHCADQCRGALELLQRQEAQRVA